MTNDSIVTKSYLNNKGVEKETLDWENEKLDDLAKFLSREISSWKFFSVIFKGVALGIIILTAGYFMLEAENFSVAIFIVLFLSGIFALVNYKVNKLIKSEKVIQINAAMHNMVLNDRKFGFVDCESNNNYNEQNRAFLRTINKTLKNEDMLITKNLCITTDYVIAKGHNGNINEPLAIPRSEIDATVFGIMKIGKKIKVTHNTLAVRLLNGEIIECNLGIALDRVTANKIRKALGTKKTDALKKLAKKRLEKIIGLASVLILSSVMTAGIWGSCIYCFNHEKSSKNEYIRQNDANYDFVTFVKYGYRDWTKHCTNGYYYTLYGVEQTGELCVVKHRAANSYVSYVSDYYENNCTYVMKNSSTSVYISDLFTENELEEIKNSRIFEGYSIDSSAILKVYEEDVDKVYAPYEFEALFERYRIAGIYLSIAGAIMILCGIRLFTLYVPRIKNTMAQKKDIDDQIRVCEENEALLLE